MSESTNAMSPSINQLQKYNAVIEFNNSQSPLDPRMTSSRSKHNQSPSQEESIGMPIQIIDQRNPSLNPLDQPGAPQLDDEFSYKAGQSAQNAQEYQKLKKLQLAQQQETLQSYQGQIGTSSNRGQNSRDESPPFGGGSRDANIRNQKQRLSQPDRINTQASYQHQNSGTGAGGASTTNNAAPTTNNQAQKRTSPKQNARSFIIRNTTQNYSVPTQPSLHQTKVLPPVIRGQPINKKGKTAMINGLANQSFQANNRPSGGAGPKKASPIDGNRDGYIRRLSQNQNSINTYLEHESKFDSTKDASDLGGQGGPGTKDYSSSLPDSIKIKGSGGGGQHDQRSYDETWQVDQVSQNSCQPGEVSYEQKRLDSAQTSLLNKRRPSAHRLNNDLFDASVENEKQPGPSSKSKKQMQHLSQPRTKDYANKAQHIRGTLQSQNQNRFADQMIDDEYYASAQMALNPDGTKKQKAGPKNYNSPVQLREMGLSQQMVPNQMKQQLKQRRTVYGQSFFNSPPFPTSSQHFGAIQQDTMAESQISGGGPAASTVDNKTRNAQLDSSLRRQRQLPVPTSSYLSQQPQQVVVVQSSKPKKQLHQRLMSGSNQVHQPQPPQSQQRKTLQRHIESTAQHLEFDERQQNEGKISQLSQFNVYQAGMRNVLTAGENNPRVVDHFPVSRASRWKQQNQNINNPHQQVSGNVYDHMMNMDVDGAGAGAGSAGMMQMPFPSDQMPGVSRLPQQNMVQQHPLQASPPLFQDAVANEKRVSGGAKHRGGGSRGLGKQLTNQQVQHNAQNFPKRSGTASYITQGGVRITINKDNKHLNGDNLTTQTEENMNLMFYDFNNATTNQVIPEETQRNLLRSQTTDRGPSRKLRSRGRFKLASSNQQKRGEDDAGLGEIRPFGVSTEFEMGMYPPESSYLDCDDLAQDSMYMMQNEAYNNAPEGKIHSSLQKKDLNNGSSNAVPTNSKNSKNGNRNIQGKRLSSQTIVQRQSQGSKHGQGSLHSNSMISSHQQKQPNNKEHAESPNHANQSAGQRRIQKQYRAADGITAADSTTSNHGVIIKSSSSSSKPNNNRSNMPNSSGKIIKGAAHGHPYNQNQNQQQPRSELFRKFSREGGSNSNHSSQGQSIKGHGGDESPQNNQAKSSQQQKSHHQTTLNNHPHHTSNSNNNAAQQSQSSSSQQQQSQPTSTVNNNNNSNNNSGSNNTSSSSSKPLSRIAQHRQTNLANVMESIREEEPHL